MHLLLAGKRAPLEPLLAKLEQLSPERTLERGYAIVFDAAGNVLKQASQTAAGEPIRVRLARGQLAAKVETVIPE